MSLSERSRLPVSNLRLSAHISAPWTRKKSQKGNKGFERQKQSGQSEALRCRSCTARSLADRELEQRGLAPSLGPAEACVLSGSELWKPHRCLCSTKRSCSSLCKISSTFTSPFCHLLLQTWRGQRAVPLHNVISGLLLQHTPHAWAALKHKFRCFFITIII